MEELKLAEPQKGGRGTHADGPGLKANCLYTIRVVPDTTNLVAGGDHAQRARGGHAQVVHRLARQELADARPEDGAAVELAREGCDARTFELHLQPLHLPDRDGTPVAALAAITAGERGAVCGGPAFKTVGRGSGDGAEEGIRLTVGRGQADQLRHFGRVANQRRGRRWNRRPNTHVVCADDLAGLPGRLAGLVRPEFAQKAVVHRCGPLAHGDGRQGQCPSQRPA
mmetsp:Transcript_12915/g.42247  ORF Transcript_12915/g.42247 Transcript_12915/m.42247 type:complete len:226 (+) Transcript_12915:1188-1865(+)